MVISAPSSANTMIYLDANATSTVRPEAREAIASLLADGTTIRNPSSVHGAGRRARSALRRARGSVLDLLALNSEQANLVFTSGGTEACNLITLGLLGGMEALVKYPGHVVCSAIEHAAMLETVDLLKGLGWAVTSVAPNEQGVLQVDDIVSAVENSTQLVVMMGANNETGALQPICDTARALRASGYQGIISSDMVQSLGKSTLKGVDVFSAGVDAIAVTGHKVGAPAGIGAAVFNRSSDRCLLVRPQLFGGPQEDRMRGGTENLLGAVAFGAVADALCAQPSAHIRNTRALRDLLWRELEAAVPDLFRLGPLDLEQCISNTLLLRVAGCRGDDLVVALDINGVAASTGSACASGKQEPSQVARAMGLSEDEAREVLRLSLDWSTTEEQLRKAVNTIGQTIAQVRRASVSLSPTEAEQGVLS